MKKKNIKINNITFKLVCLIKDMKYIYQNDKIYIKNYILIKN